MIVCLSKRTLSFLYYNFCLCKSLKEPAPMERITALPVPRGRSGLVCGCKGTAFQRTGKAFAPFIWKNSQDTIIHIIYNTRARWNEVLSGHSFIYCCPWKIMCTSIYVPIHRLPDDNQFKGACQKSRRDERPQTGAQAPGNSATAKEVPKGRQRHKQFDINKLCVLSPILGLVLLMYLSRGFHPRL